MALNFIKEHIEEMKKKNPTLEKMQDYHVFTVLCIKDFFFGEGIPLDLSAIEEMLTDGAKDGGIDAIFNDPNSEGNDMIIVQSKYYDKTSLKGEEVAGELQKIINTIDAIEACRVSDFNQQVVSAYRNAKRKMGDTGRIRIVFFTSYLPKSAKERRKIEGYAKGISKNYPLEVNFANDIEAQMEAVDSNQFWVDFDQLEMDMPNNVLRHGESVIVNISAQSLQNVQNRRRNLLLGKNLRFYVRNKEVDEAMKKTILEEPENFWDKNNGLTVICNRFELEGNVLKLYNFSIVNGGQTTNRIGRINLEKDFHLACKVIKRKGETVQEREKFDEEIAESTNTQKPVKKADLKSNSPEQRRLRKKLQEKQVYYKLKRGDKEPRQYREPFQTTTLEQVGKISLAAVLQMPGSARSSAQKMYQEEYYPLIFGAGANEGVIADLLRISYYYDCFLKTQIQDQGYDDRTVLPMLKNGKTFQLAAIGFLCKIHRKVFTYDMVSEAFGNPEKLKKLLCRTGEMDQLIMKTTQDERKLFFQIFSEIGEEVLGYCFSNALDTAEEKQSTLAASDYLKSDRTYYKDVIKRLWRVYMKRTGLFQSICEICGA